MGLLARICYPVMLFVLFSILGQCEMSIYPGLRRKPLSQALQQQAYEISDTEFWSQLLEDNARRRLQQQFEQQLELINIQLDRQRLREEQNRRLERERERYKQNQLQLRRQKQLQQQQRQQLEERENWRALKEGRDKIETANNAEYATTYTYDKNKNGNRPYDKYENDSYNNKYANIKLAQGKNTLQQRIPFAVPPSDPRYYVNENKDYDEQIVDNEMLEPLESGVITESESGESAEDLDPRTLAEYEEYVPAQSTPNVIEIKGPIDNVVADNAQHLDQVVAAPSFPAGAVVYPTHASNAAGVATFHRIKPPSAVAAAAVAAGVKVPLAEQTVSRHDLNALIDKYRKNGELDNNANDQEHLVVRHYMGMNDADWGIYVVALVAGLSAAVTVGFIAIGFAWVHHKTKAAADVEYPAYGVTGPNRDISPSGDRKLAQSAQMYHYQHQKQQIMAMENRPVEGGMSDVESDDDNEEGDYTVYECPGLAPTGEMEVKNPLFLDETPVNTPSATANIVAAPVNVNANTKPTSNANIQGSIKQKKNASNDLNLSTQSSENKKKDKK